MAYELYPAVDENYNFPPEVRGALATSTELRNTIIPMTQTARNNLTGAELWDGRTIFNTTTDRINRYDAANTVWKGIAGEEDVAAVDAAVDALDLRIDTLETHGVYGNQPLSIWAAGSAPGTAYGRKARIGNFMHVTGRISVTGAVAAGRVYFPDIPAPALSAAYPTIILPGAVQCRINATTRNIPFALERDNTENIWFLWDTAQVTAPLAAGDWFSINALFPAA